MPRGYVFTPESFWARVDRTDECWLWTGPLNRDGYGKVGRNGRRESPHRVAYELEVGPIPTGLELDHLCKVRHCVNPAHLEPVTHLENIARSRYGGGPTRTHCFRGHELTAENTYTEPGRPNTRICRECRRISGRAHDSRRVPRNRKKIA